MDRRRDHTPLLTDLEMIGDIEQLVDMVIFLLRPYYITDDHGRTLLQTLPGPTTVTIAKNRHGSIGFCELRIIEFGISEMTYWTWNQSNLSQIASEIKDGMQRAANGRSIFIPQYQLGYFNTRYHLRRLFFGIQEFLDGLHYPLCFMDFETVFMIPVPLWDGTGPYKHAPFQFSLHIIEEQGAEPRHIEFLSDGVSDPRIEFIDKLLTSLPPDACILVWNKTFERLRLQELAVAFPDYRDAIRQIIQNIRDLMVPFQDMSIWQRRN